MKIGLGVQEELLYGVSEAKDVWVVALIAAALRCLATRFAIRADGFYQKVTALLIVWNSSFQAVLKRAHTKWRQNHRSVDLFKRTQGERRTL